MKIEKQCRLGVVAFDQPGSRRARVFGKILASSLLRSTFDGDVLLYRNCPQPLFPVERVGLFEIEVDPQEDFSSPEHVREGSINWRFEMARRLVALPPAKWTIICDMDVVPLRNWDHLFEGRTEDLLVNPDHRGRPDAGFFAVRDRRYVEFVQTWEESGNRTRTAGEDRKDQQALEALIQSGTWKTGAFERGEVLRPFDKESPLLHTEPPPTLVSGQAGRPGFEKRIPSSLNR